MIIISAPMTLKQILGIERSNLRSPKDSPIIFDAHSLHPQSPAGIYLLGEYYKKLEKSPTLPVSAPEIIAIKKASSVDGKITCYHCQKETEASKITLDHFLPTYLGGNVSLSNIRLSCSPCNTMKGSIHPILMPKCWELYLFLVKEKQWMSSLELLIQTQNSEKCEESELKLIRQIVKKEIEWRIDAGKELALLERLNILPSIISKTA